MTKLPRISVFGGIAVLLTCVLVAALNLQSRAGPDSDVGSAWVAVKTNAATRDTRILDAIVGDALTNKRLASTMEFYGGDSIRTVRYTGFPAGYKPTAPGYEFVPLPREPATGRKLTILLRRLWIDHDLPKDEFSFGLDQATKRGARLAIFNSGDGTIGSCAVGYEIQEAEGGWRIRYVESFDP